MTNCGFFLLTHLTLLGYRMSNVASMTPTPSQEAFGDVCSETTLCDTTSDPNIECIQTAADKKCLCKDGWYRPNTSPTSCVETTQLKPVIIDPPPIGTGTIGISWTNTDVTGGYTFSSYTVLWSPGSPGSASTQQKNYNIPSLSPGTEYTVIVTYTITLHGRSQTITSDQKSFTTATLQVFGDVCSDMIQCDNSDSNIDCVQITGIIEKRCLCRDGMYKPSSSSPCTDTSSLKPVIVNTPTIGTGNIGISWTNADVTGGYSYSYTVVWSPVPPGSPGSASTQQKNYNIQSLSPGTEYTVSVRYTITLHGRRQTIISDPKTFTTKQAFAGVCSESSQCDTSDSNIECIQTTGPPDKKCLCKNGWYRPNTSPTSCVETSVLRPVITDPPSIGTGNIGISWTNTDVTGGYSYSYTVVWSPVPPGSPGSASTQQKTYNIQSLSQGTEYTVTVAHTITRYSRSLTITSVQRTFTTKIAYNEPCSQSGLCFDARTNCYSGRCRCDEGYYRATNCSSIEQLRPTSVTADVHNTTTMTASWEPYSNPFITGYEVTVTPGDIAPISVGRDSRTTPITGLIPGRQYTVSVKTTITYLPGRDEMTDAVLAAPKRTKQAFGGVCNDTFKCATASGSNIQCIQTTESNKKCLCRDGWYRPLTACQEYSTLKPVITDQPSIGTGNIDISWTHTGVTGGYTSSFTVSWSPGSPGSATTQQTTYNIQSLSPGTAVTVTVAHTITLYGRSQSIVSDQKMFITRIGYNETCAQGDLCFDAHSNCYSGRCRCDQGYYRITTCTSIEQLRPTSVAAYVNDTTTMTASWVAPSNAVITGYEVSVTPGGITPISVGTDIRTTPITGLTPGRLYTVSVKTKITYLQGRDEMTDAVPAASKRTHAGNISPVSCVGERSSCPSFTYRIGQLRRIPLALSPATGFTRWILLLRQPLVLQQL